VSVFSSFLVWPVTGALWTAAGTCCRAWLSSGSVY